MKQNANWGGTLHRANLRGEGCSQPGYGMPAPPRGDCVYSGVVGNTARRRLGAEQVGYGGAVSIEIRRPSETTTFPSPIFSNSSQLYKGIPIGPSPKSTPSETTTFRGPEIIENRLTHPVDKHPPPPPHSPCAAACSRRLVDAAAPCPVQRRQRRAAPWPELGPELDLYFDPELRLSLFWKPTHPAN